MSPQTLEQNPNPMPHLTDLDLDEVLLGDPSPAALDHLATCDDCSARLDSVAEPIATFGAVSLAWSERRSATLPPREENFGDSFGRATAAPGWFRRHGWLAATAAAVALVLAVPMHFGDRQPAPPNHAVADAEGPATASTSTNPQQPSSDSGDLSRQRQIEADNQMLAAIDHELDASQDRLASFGLNVSASHTRTRSHTAAPSQD